MELETVALLAELRYRILEAAVMVKDEYTKEEVIDHLIETAESINQKYLIKKE